jgi:cytidine deaminase
VITTDELDVLTRAAVGAAMNAYAPYSAFRVGAAVFTDRGVFTGANVENASYGLSLCAERAAFAAAVNAGARQCRAIVIHFGDPGGAPAQALRPCGACRQWMIELMAPDATVHIANTGETFTLEALLPNAFVLKKPDGGR